MQNGPVAFGVTVIVDSVPAEILYHRYPACEFDAVLACVNPVGGVVAKLSPLCATTIRFPEVGVAQPCPEPIASDAAPAVAAVSFPADWIRVLTARRATRR